METAASRNTSQSGLRCNAGLKLTVSESQVFKKVPYHPCLSKEGPTWAKGMTPPTGPQEVQPDPHPELSGLGLPANDRGGGLCGRFQAHSPGVGIPQGLSP